MQTVTRRSKTLLVLGLVLLAAFWPGLWKLAKTRWRSHMLEQRISALRSGNQQLREVAERLDSDPLYIEQVARERFGLAREGETILYFDDRN